jgi:hypothetical protein
MPAPSVALDRFDGPLPRGLTRGTCVTTDPVALTLKRQSISRERGATDGGLSCLSRLQALSGLDADLPALSRGGRR